MGCACIKAKMSRVRPVPVRMDVGGRNEAARRRRSIALEKQRTYSTVENHINQVKHSKDREESSKCEKHGKNDVITEEHAGGIVDTEGQQSRDVEEHAADIVDIEGQQNRDVEEHPGDIVDIEGQQNRDVEEHPGDIVDIEGQQNRDVEEHAGGIVDIEGQQSRDVEDTDRISQWCYQPDEQSVNLNTPSYEE